MNVPLACAYALVSFLVGAIPFGLVVGRLVFRTDLRESGSGNIGAANALRTLGRGAGVTVLLLDACKGALPVLAISTIAPLHGLQELAPCFAFAAVVGHCYSPFLHFQGGKGVATFLGATFALMPVAGLIFVIVWAAVALTTSFASAASLFATAAAGVTILLGANGAWPAVASVTGAAFVIVWRHRANLARLRAGTETRTELLRRH